MLFKITIAETQPVFAEGIAKMLSQTSGLQLNQLTTCYDELIATMKTDPADVLLLDAELNNAFSEEIFIRQLKKEYPTLKIILFSKTLRLGHLPKLRRAGLNAYLSKNVSCQELRKAITVVVEGGSYLEESLRRSLDCFSVEVNNQSKKDERRFTNREREILSLIVEEFTNQEIANQLYISIPTVETHRKNLIVKMGVKNTAGLVREAILGRWYTGLYHGFS